MTPAALANWRARGRARARLAARPRRRLRLPDRAGQARHLRRADAVRRIAQGRRRVARRPDSSRRCRTPASPSTCVPGCSRPRRASGSITRPIRTGTTAAHWSHTSGSSSAVRARVPPHAARVDAGRLRAGRSRRRGTRSGGDDGAEARAARDRSRAACRRGRAAHASSSPQGRGTRPTRKGGWSPRSTTPHCRAP